MIALADCAVTVANARESARWWSEKLGFDVHRVAGGEHGVMVAPPGDRFVIHLCEGFAPVEPGDSGIAFMTDEIEPLVRRMEAAGVRFTEPLRKESWGGVAKFADPDGNVFWLLGASSGFVRNEARRRAVGGRRPAPPARTRRPSRPKRRAHR